MRLKCDTCMQEVEVAEPVCVYCSNYDDDCDYCYSYESKVSASFMNHDPRTTHCSYFATTCECEGLLEKK